MRITVEHYGLVVTIDEDIETADAFLDCAIRAGVALGYPPEALGDAVVSRAALECEGDEP